jgi:hypothetical protein
VTLGIQIVFSFSAFTHMIESYIVHFNVPMGVDFLGISKCHISDANSSLPTGILFIVAS